MFGLDLVALRLSGPVDGGLLVLVWGACTLLIAVPLDKLMDYFKVPDGWFDSLLIAGGIAMWTTIMLLVIQVFRWVF